MGKGNFTCHQGSCHQGSPNDSLSLDCLHLPLFTGRCSREIFHVWQNSVFVKFNLNLLKSLMGFLCHKYSFLIYITVSEKEKYLILYPNDILLSEKRSERWGYLISHTPQTGMGLTGCQFSGWVLKAPCWQVGWNAWIQSGNKGR